MIRRTEGREFRLRIGTRLVHGEDGQKSGHSDQEIAHRDGNEGHQRAIHSKVLGKNEKNRSIKPGKPIRIIYMTPKTNLEQTQ